MKVVQVGVRNSTDKTKDYKKTAKQFEKYLWMYFGCPHTQLTLQEVVIAGVHPSVPQSRRLSGEDRWPFFSLFS